eukprot:3346627-Pleurochrysis_carterae.AAC.1
MDVTLPPADSISCTSIGPSRDMRRATSRPSVKYTRPSFCLNIVSAPLLLHPSRLMVVKSIGDG